MKPIPLTLKIILPKCNTGNIGKVMGSYYVATIGHCRGVEDQGMRICFTLEELYNQSGFQRATH